MYAPGRMRRKGTRAAYIRTNREYEIYDMPPVKLGPITLHISANNHKIVARILCINKHMDGHCVATLVGRCVMPPCHYPLLSVVSRVARNCVSVVFVCCICLVARWSLENILRFN